jgi:hypothetical protein
METSPDIPCKKVRLAKMSALVIASDRFVNSRFKQRKYLC